MGTVMRGIEDYYRTMITDLSVGDRLPSERQVMRELGTCRSSVRIILTKLSAEKLVIPIHGKGYYKR